MIAMLRMSFGISSHPYRWCLQATLAVAWPPMWAIYSPSNRCNLETWTFLRPWLLGNHPTGRSTSRIWLVRWRCRTAPARVPWAWETWTETIQTCSVCRLMFGIFFVAWSNGLYFGVLGNQAIRPDQWMAIFSRAQRLISTNGPETQWCNGKSPVSTSTVPWQEGLCGEPAMWTC